MNADLAAKEANWTSTEKVESELFSRGGSPPLAVEDVEEEVQEVEATAKTLEELKINFQTTPKGTFTISEVRDCHPTSQDVPQQLQPQEGRSIRTSSKHAPVTKAPVTKAPVTKAPVLKAPVVKIPVTPAKSKVVKTVAPRKTLLPRPLRLTSPWPPR